MQVAFRMLIERLKNGQQDCRVTWRILQTGDGAKSSRLIEFVISIEPKNSYQENVPTCVKGSSVSLRFLLN